MNTRFLKTMKGLALVLAVTLLAAACMPKIAAAPPAAPATPTPAVTPAVTVNDQAIMNGQVIVAEVDSAGSGWIVIHAQANGQPGPVIGYTAVNNGINLNVVVNIDVTKATPVLYAMLHLDVGVVGKYEFPGADKPAVANGKPVSPPFNVTGLPTPTVSSSPMILATPTTPPPAYGGSGGSGGSGGGGGYSY